MPTPVRYLHYAAASVERVLDTVRPLSPSTKPIGLWFSVSGNGHYGWYEWCQDNDFNLDRLSVVHELTLAPDARVLRITTARQLKEFTKVYATPLLPPTRLNVIEWGRVAEEYDGIVIAPYLAECRLDDRLFWYYGWDCASGCVWRSRAVASLTVLPPETA